MLEERQCYPIRTLQRDKHKLIMRQVIATSLKGAPACHVMKQYSAERCRGLHQL